MKQMAIVFAGIALSGCASLHSDPYGMSFKSSNCMKPASLNSLAPVVSSRWIGETFIVDVNNPIICNAHIVRPAYALEGRTLTVSYEAKLGRSVAKCYCDTSVTYQFSKLPAASYQVRFVTTN